jgi:MFS family permease
MRHPSQEASALTTRHTFLLVVLLGALSGLGPLAIDMYLPAFTVIARDFSASPPMIERTLAVYFAGLAFGQLFHGPCTSDVLSAAGADLLHCSTYPAAAFASAPARLR